MTQDEIDGFLEAMQANFEKSGDDAARPGLITFQRDDRIGAGLPCCCTSPARGVRYRGVRIKISQGRQTRTWTRGEVLAAGDDGGPYEDLKSREDAAV